MALLVKPDGTYREVKNLGWLLHNWQRVHRFELEHRPGGRGFMRAFLNNGGRYETDWASYTLMLNWLDRPVFRGVQIGEVVK